MFGLISRLPSARHTGPAPVERARLSTDELAPASETTGTWPGHTVDVAGTRLHVRTTPADDPDAEPAVFVHGLGGSALNWTDVAGLLKRRLAIEALDLPGFGRSGPPPRRNYTIEAHARTVIAYLEDSARGPVHLVGNSMGGAVSIAVAARRPDLVRTLTLISPAVPDIRLRAHPLRSDWRMALLVVPGLGGLAMRRAAGLPAETRVKATIALCFADRHRYPRQRLAEDVAELESRVDMEWATEAFLRSLRGLVQTQFVRGRSAWATLRSVRVPTLVIWGDTDRLVAPDLAEHVAAAVPGSRLLLLEGVGHTAMMEQPDTTARAILGLVEDARTASVQA